MKSVLIIVVVLGVSFGAKLPSDWKLCKDSKELGKCLVPAIEDALSKMKDGVADLNIPPLEPVNIPSVTIGEGTGTVHVVQNYKNFKIFGISSVKIPKMDATYSSSDGLTLDIEAFAATAKIVADYDFNGRILVLPIVGNGECQVTLKDTVVKVKLLSKQIEKKGRKHLKVTSVKVELIPANVTYNFEKLFNGDPVLGPQMNKVLNDNSQDVFLDVKSGYENVLAAVFEDYADKVFSKVPSDEIF